MCTARCIHPVQRILHQAQGFERELAGTFQPKLGSSAAWIKCCLDQVPPRKKSGRFGGENWRGHVSNRPCGRTGPIRGSHPRGNYGIIFLYNYPYDILCIIIRPPHTPPAHLAGVRHAGVARPRPPSRPSSGPAPHPSRPGSPSESVRSPFESARLPIRVGPAPMLGPARVYGPARGRAGSHGLDAPHVRRNC